MNYRLSSESRSFYDIISSVPANQISHGRLGAFFESQLQLQPQHFPDENPCLWQSSRHVVSEAQRANSSAGTVCSLHSQIWFSVACAPTQDPSTLPMAWQVLRQTSPLESSSHRVSRTARKAWRSIVLSEQWQTPAGSQFPDV